MSPLNPYAAPFIPFSKQRADNENVVPITSENSKIDDATVQCKQVGEDEARAIQRTCGDPKMSYESPQHQLPTNTYIEGPPDSRVLLGKDCNIHSFQDPISRKTRDGTEKHSYLEQELHLAYLTAEFPGMSEQSLLDVYCANAGDLEASVDMLIQLEEDADPCLPDSLEVDLYGLESGTVCDSSRMQKTTTHGEASGSSSLPFAS